MVGIRLMMHQLILIGAATQFLQIPSKLAGRRLAETTMYAPWMGKGKERIRNHLQFEDPWGFYSLAITHGEVLAAALEKVTIVVARGAVTATLSIVLQYLLKEFRAIAIEDRWCLWHPALAAGDDVLCVPKHAAVHTMAFGVIDQGQHFDAGVRATGAPDLQDEMRWEGARIEIRSCLFWVCT